MSFSNTFVMSNHIFFHIELIFNWEISNLNILWSEKGSKISFAFEIVCALCATIVIAAGFIKLDAYPESITESRDLTDKHYGATTMRWWEQGLAPLANPKRICLLFLVIWDNLLLMSVHKVRVLSHLLCFELPEGVLSARVIVFRYNILVNL